MTVQQRPIHRPGSPESAYDESQYAAFAAAQFRILKDYMALAKLNTYSRVVTLANGVVITCQKSFNREDIFISVPQSQEYTYYLPVVYRFYIMHLNFTFVRDDPKMVELTGRNIGAFRASAKTSLSSPYTPLTRLQSPLTPEENYAMPWTAVVSDDGGSWGMYFITVHADCFKMWTASAGDSGPSKVIGFTEVVPDGTYNGYSIYQANTFRIEKSNKTKLFAYVYQLGGHYDDFAAMTRPIHTKLVTYNSEPTHEYTASSIPVVLQRYSMLPGIFYRKMFEVLDSTRITYDTFMYKHSADTFSGNLSKLTYTDEGLSSELILSTEPGYRDSTHWIDNICDIFTAPESKYYYVIKYTSDIYIQFAGLSYGGEVSFNSGTRLSVVKYSKEDWSVVETYELTPTTIDHAMQGLPASAMTINANTDTAYNQEYHVNLTRFVPVGVNTDTTTATGVVSSLTPQIAGAVIVKDGVEYPLLAVNVITQSYFYDTEAEQLAFLADPETYSATHYTYSKTGNISQPALLWLGGTAGYQWAGVNARGIDFAPHSQDNRTLGLFRGFLREPICDSEIAYFQLRSYYGNGGLNTYSKQLDANNIDGVHYATQDDFITVDNTDVQVGDVFTVELSDCVNTGNDKVVIYTAVTGDDNAAIKAALLVRIIEAGFVATSAPTGIAVPVTESGYVRTISSAARPAWAWSRYGYLLSVKIEDEIPKVSVESRQHDAAPFFLYELDYPEEPKPVKKLIN